MMSLPRVVIVFWCASLVVMAGCSREAKDEPEILAPAYDSIIFDTPDDAVASLVAALRDADDELLGEILGVMPEQILTGDEVSDETARESFLTALQERGEFKTTEEGWVVLLCGEDQWPFPFPLIQEPEGWRFLGTAGLDEVYLRAIGSNELAAHAALRGIVAAQNEFALQYGQGSYALFINSPPGAQDGLYWESGDESSPVGPKLSAAEYGAQHRDDAKPYYGYWFRMVTAEGFDDFYVLAWPDEYARTGVMTLLIDRNGILYERDFGPETGEVVPEHEADISEPEWSIVEVLNAVTRGE